jgi:Mrp family chromosome partitioning ATPase
MLQFLGRTFGQIIFDSPPVLTFGDSLILSNSVDGVVLVVLSGRTPREALRQSKNALHQVNAKILGVVVNQVDIEQTRYGHYSYGNYHYYEQEEETKELPRQISKDRSNKASLRKSFYLSTHPMVFERETCRPGGGHLFKDRPSEDISKGLKIAL